MDFAERMEARRCYLQSIRDQQRIENQNFTNSVNDFLGRVVDANGNKIPYAEAVAMMEQECGNNIKLRKLMKKI